MESSEIEGVVTTEVRETHRFDVAALERYMREHVEGFRGPVTVRQFHGGQSCPTYYLESPSGKYVLRRKPPGKLLPSAHAVDREYRVITALGGTDVPVPRTYALCEDPDVVGTAFYIMEYVHGRLMVEPGLPGVAPAERTRALRRDEPRARAPAHRGRRRRRPRGLRQARQLLRAPDPSLDPAVPRV